MPSKSVVVDDEDSGQTETCGSLASSCPVFEFSLFCVVLVLADKTILMETGDGTVNEEK